MTGRNISTAGHMSSVAPFLTNLTSLDLSNNLFLGPSQVAKILTATPALRFLSLSSNALSPDPVPSQSTRTDGRAARNEDGLKAPVQDLNLNEGEVGEKWWCEELPMMAHLLHLRLSNTGLAAAEAAEWVRRAPQLSELHFCSNHVATRGEVAEIAAALPESIKTLFLNDNRLSRLSDALPLGHLRGLRVLSLGGNPMRLEGFLEDTLVESQWESSEDLAVESQLGNGEQGRRGEGGHEGDEKSLSGLNGQKSAGLGLFIGLECLFLSATAIEDLGSLDQLRCLPVRALLSDFSRWCAVVEAQSWLPFLAQALTDVRLQQTPLLRSLRDEDQFRLLVAVLPMAQHINGSKVTDKERPSAERAFVR